MGIPVVDWGHGHSARTSEVQQTDHRRICRFDRWGYLCRFGSYGWRTPEVCLT